VSEIILSIELTHLVTRARSIHMHTQHKITSSVDENLYSLHHLDVKCSTRINTVINSTPLNVVLHRGYADKILYNLQAACTAMQ